MFTIKSTPKEARCRVEGMRAEILLGIYAVERIYYKFGQNLVITCVTDGTHRPDSLHPQGYAVDFRLPAPDKLDRIMTEINQVLGPDYDLVKEKDHLHLEFDPKG